MSPGKTITRGQRYYQYYDPVSDIKSEISLLDPADLSHELR